MLVSLESTSASLLLLPLVELLPRLILYIAMFGLLLCLAPLAASIISYLLMIFHAITGLFLSNSSLTCLLSFGSFILMSALTLGRLFGLSNATMGMSLIAPKIAISFFPSER